MTLAEVFCKRSTLQKHLVLIDVFSFQPILEDDETQATYTESFNYKTLHEDE